MNFDFHKPLGIAGYGVEGKSVMRWLQKHGAADITVFDEKVPPTEIPAGVKFQNSFSDFGAVQILFRSPGVHPEKLANFSGQRTSATQLFFELAPTKNIIGITGTKGKGTTASLLFKMLQTAGTDVWLGGNIGTPVFDFFDELTPGSTVILELSSFQLLDIPAPSPRLAVFLRTTSEHLDWHRDVAEYHAAKQNLVAAQTAQDRVVFCADDPVAAGFAASSPAEKYGCSRQQKIVPGCFVQEQKIFFQENSAAPPEEIAAVAEVRLKGDFQLENVTAAVAAAKLLKIPGSSIREAIQNFPGLPYRLEFRGVKKGITFYNDSFATIPESTVAALSAFPEEPLILILGGSSKNSDYRALAAKIIQMPNLKKIFFCGQTGPEIFAAVQNAAAVAGISLAADKYDFQNSGLPEIFGKLKKTAAAGETVLLSPASASFDQFQNYKERGDVFNRLVEAF